MSTRRDGTTGGATGSIEGYADDTYWWRCNRSIRCYGLLALVEANPLADRLFAEIGLLAGLVLAGMLTRRSSLIFPVSSVESVVPPRTAAIVDLGKAALVTRLLTRRSSSHQQ